MPIASFCEYFAHYVYTRIHYRALRFVLSPFRAAFIQRFFGNNFPRRTRARLRHRLRISYYIIIYMCNTKFLPGVNSNKYSPPGECRKPRSFSPYVTPRRAAAARIHT